MEAIEKSPKLKRIILEPSSENILNNWKEQIKKAYPGFEPSSKELISWVLNKFPTLTNNYITQIKEELFDDVKYLSSIVEQLRKEKIKSDKTEIKKLLQNLYNEKMPRKATKAIKAASEESPNEFSTFMGTKSTK
jgi:hypothetical protein